MQEAAKQRAVHAGEDLKSRKEGTEGSEPKGGGGKTGVVPSKLMPTCDEGPSSLHKQTPDLGGLWLPACKLATLANWSALANTSALR